MNLELPDGESIPNKLFSVNLTEAQKKLFWDKVDVREEDDCWNWLHAKSSKGYGQIKIHYVQYVATRVCYFMHHEAFDDRLLICHHCDNPSCVNPKHLWLGDAKQNAEDRDSKGRYVIGDLPVGEDHFSAKLTDEKVLQIRCLYEIGGYSHRELGNMFGVAKETVSALLQGRTWKHLL